MQPRFRAVHLVPFTLSSSKGLVACNQDNDCLSPNGTGGVRRRPERRQQYLALQQHLVPPDTFRLRYRNALNEVVAAIVRKLESATAARIRKKIPAAVQAVDRERFVALVLTEFKALHSGNAVRFGLLPLEYSAWAAKHKTQPY